jgi:type IV fimbrial biogenesis protein FimT
MRKLIKLKRPIKAQSGMSLIELMASIIVMSILATVAVPAMKSLFDKKSVFSIGDLFVKSIKYARIEAIQRGRSVRVIAESGTSDWSQGWRIEFTNESGSDELIRTFPALPNTPVFSSVEFDGSLPLTIAPSGQVSNIGSFDLYFSGCDGPKRLNYNLLLSGLLQKRIVTCP